MARKTLRASWYPDPYALEERRWLRYWDGERWSEETRRVDGGWPRFMEFGRPALRLRRRHLRCVWCDQPIPRSKPKSAACSVACAHAWQLAVIEAAHGGPRPKRAAEMARQGAMSS